MAEKAAAHYQEAFRLNPLDAQSVYGLAWQVDRLETIYTRLHPEDKVNPHDALPLYNLAISLRPNGIRYHYALAGYLYRTARHDDLHRVIRRLTRIFPPAYTQLKEKGFWSYDVKAACRQGLKEAIRDNILPAAAHMGLARIAEEEKDWAGAIAYYRQALQLQPMNNTDKTNFYLGRMLLKHGDVQRALNRFTKSLSLSRTREKQLENIYHLFKEEDALNEFNGFYQDIQRQFFLSDQTGILLARAFIDLKQYDQARRVIEKLNTHGSTAEAYYWLAQIAIKEKDWDRMERTIQKATVLDPENNHYRRIFFDLLKRKKKFESAELQLDLMIENSEVPSASLFDGKAWLKWRQKDYSAAVEAWQSAIRLKSDAAVYYARAAEAYIMIGDWPNAVEYYQKAVRLDPQNERFNKRYQQIMVNDSEG